VQRFGKQRNADLYARARARRAFDAQRAAELAGTLAQATQDAALQKYYDFWKKNFLTTKCGSGTYAERALVPPAHLHKLPSRTTFQQGAALGVPVQGTTTTATGTDATTTGTTTQA